MRFLNVGSLGPALVVVDSGKGRGFMVKGPKFRIRKEVDGEMIREENEYE